MEDPKSEKVALFRYGLIATLVLERLSRGELVHRARELASLHYEIPFSERTSVSVGTLLIWARRYRKGGIEAHHQSGACGYGQCGLNSHRRGNHWLCRGN